MPDTRAPPKFCHHLFVQAYIVPSYANTTSGAGMQLKLVGVLVHGFAAYAFIVPPTIKDDANLMIDILRRVLADVQQKRKDAKHGFHPALAGSTESAGGSCSQRSFQP